MDLLTDANRTIQKLYDIAEFLNEDGDLNDNSYDKVLNALEKVEKELNK